MKIVIVLFTLIFSSVSGSAGAQGAREQLNQLVTQLRATPSDTALRERIIKLAQEIKPAPSVPEEVERRMVRGSAAFKAAQNENDFKEAVREFEQASIVAPWSGDIYYNLGVAQDKAGDHSSAIRSLKLAVLAAPDSRETKNLLYEVEYRAEKASSAVAQSAKMRQQEQALIPSLEGAMFSYERYVEASGVMVTYTIHVRNSRAYYKNASVYSGSPVYTTTASCHLNQLRCESHIDGAPSTRLLLEFSADGHSVETRVVYGNGSPDNKATPEDVKRNQNVGRREHRQKLIANPLGLSWILDRRPMWRRGCPTGSPVFSK